MSPAPGGGRSERKWLPQDYGMVTEWLTMRMGSSSEDTFSTSPPEKIGLFQGRAQKNIYFFQKGKNSYMHTEDIN